MGAPVTATGEYSHYLNEVDEPSSGFELDITPTISAQYVWLASGTGNLVPPKGAWPSWLADTIDDLLDWLNQREGWDSYSANRISPRAVSIAFQFLRGISHYGIPRPFITGDTDGGISSSWESDRYSVQVDFHANSIDVFYWDKYIDEQWEGPLASAIDRLGPVLWYLSHRNDRT